MISRNEVNTAVEHKLLSMGIRNSCSVELSLELDILLSDFKSRHVIRAKRISFYCPKDRFIAELYGLDRLYKEIQFPVSEYEWLRADPNTDVLKKWTYFYEGSNA
jgi:hypothetical protein